MTCFGLSTGGAATALTPIRQTLVRYLGVLAALFMLIVWQLATQSQFATWGNFLNILETNAALLVVSVGMTFVMLAGGFDLSLGGLLALSGVLLAKLIYGGVPTLLAVVIVVVSAFGAALLCNGFLIAFVGLSFFVVTIGTGSIFRAVGLIATGGSTPGLYTNVFLQ
jgi:ribose transport system permease protein